MTFPPFPSDRRKRRGTVLIVTMVVCFALAGTVLALSRATRVETIAAANLAASVQASAVARGAEQYVLALIAQERDSIDELPETDFAAVPVGGGCFWVLRPDYDDPNLPLFGLVDESSKLNINTASYDQLLRLPGMTTDAAASIMDWKDQDTNPERTGVESYYDAPDPYTAKNGNFETVEELLLVHSFDRVMLYGDGTAPPLGSTPSLRGDVTGGMMSDPQLARGLYDVLTVYSIETNTAADGQRRIEIDDNDRDMRRTLQARLRARLDQKRADEVLIAIGTEDMPDIFEFYRRAKSTAKMTPQEFDLVADDLTTTGSRTLRGRINIRTAPRSVLLTLPGLQEDEVEKILSARASSTSSAEGSANIAWVADAIGPDRAAAARLGGQITTRSSQWSADIVAVDGRGRSFKRVRIVVDARSGTARIVYRRDLTDRGWPMDPSVLQSMRSGNGPGNWGTGYSGGRS
jgi:type II secretory pathway component PulK